MIRTFPPETMIPQRLSMVRQKNYTGVLPFTRQLESFHKPSYLIVYKFNQSQIMSDTFRSIWLRCIHCLGKISGGDNRLPAESLKVRRQALPVCRLRNRRRDFRRMIPVGIFSRRSKRRMRFLYTCYQKKRFLFSGVFFQKIDTPVGYP